MTFHAAVAHRVCTFSALALRLDALREIEHVCAAIREQVLKRLKRSGAVVAVSGDIDSSVAAALCARALGPENVLGILPESDCDLDGLRLGRTAARAFGLKTLIAQVGRRHYARAQTQHFHADRLDYAVAGTFRRYSDQGDGGADFTPIAHLYQSQVYQLADHLGVPEEIIWHAPSARDASCSSLSYREMDLCLYALDNGVAAEDAAYAAGLSAEQVRDVWRDIESRRN
jgi:NAD+ synthase